MPDGSITFSTALDNEQLEKELARVTKKVEALEEKISKKETGRNQIVDQLKAAQDEAIKAYNNVERLKEALSASQALTSGPLSTADPAEYIKELDNQKRIKDELREQEAILRQKEKAAERLEATDAKALQQLEQQTTELNRQKDLASQITDQLAATNDSSSQFSDAMEEVTGKIGKLGTRIAKLATRVFVFSTITRALREMLTWLGNVIGANDEAAAAIARLKGALLTLAQPILNIIVPAFIALINILTRIVTAIASFVSLLFGKTIDQSKDAASALNDEMAALEGVGGAAAEAAGSLAGFDEINQLAGENASGGGAAAGSGIDFGFDTSTMEIDLESLLDWIKVIAAALLAWKLSDSFLGGIQTFLGLVIAITGAVELIKGTMDAWQNGLDWDNFTQMLQGAILLVTGLGIAFGPVGAAIGLIVVGLDFLATGFHDAMENGWNLQNTIMAIAGILATGIGISILTGSFIPLLIAGIAAVLLALTVATGHGEELIGGVKDVCEGLVEFVTGIFSGDIEKAMEGVGKIFEGLKKIASAVIEGVRDTFLSFLDWLDEKTNGKLKPVIDFLKGLFTGLFENVKTTVSNMLDSVKQVLDGIIKFVTGIFTNDWDLAWEGIKDIFKGAWNNIISFLEGAVNLIIKGVNWLIKQLNKVSFTVPDWMPGIGGKSIGINIPEISEMQIPRLAAGAVIPPNRQFMAVLGDQSNGNNIEAPENLIRKIVREETGGSNTELLQAILEAIRAGQVIKVDKRVLGRTAAEGINDMTVSSGKPVLIF